MKFNKYFMLGLAGLAFAACSNDEGTPEMGDQGKAIIRLSLGKAETRSFGETAANLHNNINSLDVFFYNTAGVFVECPDKVTISDTEYDNKQAIADAVTALQNAADHKTTLTLKGVPESASQIYIVANMPEGADAIGTKSLAEARGSRILLRSQSKVGTDGEVGDFTHFSGENSTLTGLNDNIGDGSNVIVQLTPVPSRIEVKNFRAIKADESWGGADIESFELKGIYINAFYPWGVLQGTPQAERKAIDQGDIAGNYSKSAYETISYEYHKLDGTTQTITKYNFMCDEPTAEQVTYTSGAENTNQICVATPSPSTNWWGYQVLPGIPVHVVVKLNVKYVGNATPQTKFLTIKKYTQKGETNLSIDEFKRGNVYRMEYVDFKASDLTDVPYEKTKEISAQIEVLAWNPVDMEPGFN